MTTLTRVEPVAKPRDTTVRVDFGTAEMLRKVSSLRGLSTGDYIREVLGPAIRSDLASQAEQTAQEMKAKPK